MVCGHCGGGVKHIDMMAVANLESQGEGYTTLGFPGTDWYRGQHEGRSVYVIARHTTDERLFRNTQLTEASEYARSLGHVSIEHFPCVQLPQGAVESVYSP